MPTRLLPAIALAILLASTSSEAQTTLHAVHGTAQGNGEGTVASFAGDVNGDSLADWIVGFPRDDTNGTWSGMARVYSGADASVLYTLLGASAFVGLGGALDGAGDVDGDGFDDFIVGLSNGTTTAVSAFVYSGVDGSLLFTLSASPSTDNFQVSVSGAGDTNGDGRPDFVVGYRGAEEVAGDNKGSVRVFSGLDGSELFEVFGDGLVENFGYSVDAAGDVNGDGFDDVIASAIEVSVTTEAEGEVQVLSGVDGTTLYTFTAGTPLEWFGGSCAGAGDVNGDGRPDLLVGIKFEATVGWHAGAAKLYSGATGELLRTFYGSSSGAAFGVHVAGAGDMDGDGFHEVVIGADRDHLGLTNNGSATVFSGVDGRVLFKLYGDDVGDKLGLSVAGGADVDGDGRSEILVAAPGDDTGGFETGSVRVVTRSSSACLSVTAYCDGLRNSTGVGTELSFTGTTSVGANDLFLHARPGPVGESGLFFFGPTQMSLPFGNGLRCVGGSLRRLPFSPFSFWGDAAHILDNSAPEVGGLITPGSSWNFQFYYHDPGTGAGFNTSNALTIDFCP